MPTQETQEAEVRKIPWRRKWQLTPVFLLGKSYGQRSLAGHSPQGHKESDTTKVLSARACARASASARARVHTHTHTHTHTLYSGKRTTWYPYSVVETCGLGWGQVWGWRWEGDQKPKLATLGFRRSRKHSGKSFPFLLLVQRLSTFPSSLSLIFSCKISRICLSFSPHFSLPVFQFRPHSLALCS